jgi:hypothetical protein
MAKASGEAIFIEFGHGTATRINGSFPFAGKHAVARPTLS